MRIKLTLQCPKNSVIALNNRYELSSVLYKILANADKDFATWLHDKGYGADGRQFKLFTFGWLNTYPYDKVDGGQICKSGVLTWEVSFCVDELVQHFVSGLFREASFELKAGFFDEVHFKVQNVEILPLPNFTETMQYRCITPILIGQKSEGSKYETYLSPLDADFAALFLHNLRGKVKAVQGESFQDSDTVSFRLLSAPDKVRPKGFKVYKQGIAPLTYKPYLFDFEVTAPPEWQKIGFLAGFGQDASLGVGMVEIKSTTQNE